MPVITDPAYTPFFQSCDELFGVRDDMPYDMSGERHYVRQFRVVVNPAVATNRYLAGLAVTLCPGVPLAGSPYITIYQYDLNALLVRINAKEEHSDDWGCWIVTCDYSTNIPLRGGPPLGGLANDPDSPQNQPDLEYPSVEWDFEQTKVAFPHDLDGKPYTNSAGQFLSPPPEFPVHYAVLHITRNEPSFFRARAQSYAGAVNSDVFLTMDPGWVQCMAPRARQVWRGRWLFWSVSYKLNFPYVGPDDDYVSWQPRFIDQGTKQWFTQAELEAVGYEGAEAPVGGRALPIVEPGGGHAITRPVLLDGAGAKQQADFDGVVHPHWLNFRQYRSKSFVELLVRGLG